MGVNESGNHRSCACGGWLSGSAGPKLWSSLLGVSTRNAGRKAWLIVAQVIAVHLSHIIRFHRQAAQAWGVAWWCCQGPPSFIFSVLPSLMSDDLHPYACSFMVTKWLLQLWTSHPVSIIDHPSSAKHCTRMSQTLGSLTSSDLWSIVGPEMALGPAHLQWSLFLSILFAENNFEQANLYSYFLTQW